MVARPTIMGELRLFGLDDSISKDEVKEAIAAKGNCKFIEINTGGIGKMRNGSGMVWIKCPLTAAILLSKMEKIRIGWSSIRIEMLGPCEKQCFYCWKYGHLKYNCKSEIDRTGQHRCYRCGSSGHKAKECTREVQCVICKENNKNWRHRMGSIACSKNRMQTTSTTILKSSNIVSEVMEVIENTDDK